jgi:hypothetical protein
MIGPKRGTIYVLFISINSLYRFRALFCASPGSTVCTAIGIFLCVLCQLAACKIRVATVHGWENIARKVLPELSAIDYTRVLSLMMTVLLSKNVTLTSGKGFRHGHLGAMVIIMVKTKTHLWTSQISLPKPDQDHSLPSAGWWCIW